MKPPERLPRQPGRPASPDVSAAQRAPLLVHGVPAYKLIAPPLPCLAARLLPLCPLHWVQDANPLWPVRISSFPPLL